jgi:glycosyltransferase involved in cell wall biosynthesis
MPSQTATCTGTVLHVLKVFRPTFTGAGIFLERIAPVFATLAPGIRHDLLVVDTPRPAHPETASAIGNVVYLQKSSAPPWYREILLLWWLIRNLGRYQVIHFHTHTDRYFLAYVIAKLAQKRLVLTATLDDSFPTIVDSYRPLYRPLIARLLRLFDVFIAISPKLRDESAAKAGAEKVRLIPIGVAVPAEPARDRAVTRLAYGIKDGDIVLIFVGGICTRKDPLFLIERMLAIRAFCPQAKLAIVGPVLEPDYHATLTARVRECRLEDAVIFTGEVRDPYPLFGMADIVVFASHLEGFGSAVTEGMAHGLPAVVRHLPGVNDQFVHEGETGFHFTTVGEYLTALRRLIENPELRCQVGAAARNLIAAEFDNVRNATRMLEVYSLGKPHAASDAPHG